MTSSSAKSTRLAHLKQKLEELQERGVNVLAGTHVYRWKDDDGALAIKIILRVSFVQAPLEELY